MVDTKPEDALAEPEVTLTTGVQSPASALEEDSVETVDQAASSGNGHDPTSEAATTKKSSRHSYTAVNIVTKLDQITKMTYLLHAVNL